MRNGQHLATGGFAEAGVGGIGEEGKEAFQVLG